MENEKIKINEYFKFDNEQYHKNKLCSILIKLIQKDVEEIQIIENNY